MARHGVHQVDNAAAPMRRVDTMSAASDFYKQLSPVRSPVLRSLPYRIALYDFLLDSSPLPGSDLRFSHSPARAITL